MCKNWTMRTERKREKELTMKWKWRAFFSGPTKHRVVGIWRFNSESLSESRLTVRGSDKRQRRDTIRSERLQRSFRHNRIAATKSLRTLCRAAHQRQEENTESYVWRVFRIVSNREWNSNIERHTCWHLATKDYKIFYICLQCILYYKIVTMLQNKFYLSSLL